MTIRDDWQKLRTGESSEHVGLIYTVELEAENLVDSIHKATSEARHVTNQLSFTHGAAIEYPLPRFSIDVDPSCPDRELAQLIYNMPALYQPRRAFNPSTYGTLFERLERLRASNSEGAKRIDRALDYLRSSFLDLEPLDQFEDAWTALEALNPLVQRKYSPPPPSQQTCRECKTPVFCKNCGAVVRPHYSASGIDYIITNILQESDAKARELKTTRNSIDHAYADFSTVLTDIVEKTHLAQRAVAAGILDMLDFPEDQRSSLMRSMLTIASNSRVLVSAILYDLPVETLRASARYPQLELKFCEAARPYSPQEYARETCPLAVTAYITVHNFSGAWDLLAMRWLFTYDSEAGEPRVELLPQKWPVSKVEG